MQRANVNLLRNALRYGRRHVHVSAERIDERTRVHVDDDGPGIPAGTEATLFEPFARLDSSRTRDTGGHGLGLAIVQQVAKLHGGSAHIARSPLGGARVTIEW
jgi:signal transduction histidine kinase